MKSSLQSAEPRLIAIVGGSGAGKSWIATQLQSQFGKEAAVLHLDDFYADRSHLPFSRRTAVNFDHPRSIDWRAFEQVLTACKAGEPARVPTYDFTTHARAQRLNWLRPKPIIIVEGLWLLRRRSVRQLFDGSVFVDCPGALQLRRRIARDVAERGRSEASVREQYYGRVVPMHVRHVLPQREQADVVVQSPVRPTAVEKLVRWIREMGAIPATGEGAGGGRARTRDRNGGDEGRAVCRV